MNQQIVITLTPEGAVRMTSPEGMPPAQVIGVLAIAQALVTSRIVKPAAQPSPGIVVPQPALIQG